jgi:hypothetical protein
MGLYRVKLRGHFFSKYYLVTRNVFPLLQGHDTFIHAKYDLKGSTQGRVSMGLSSVLKDVDLMRSGRNFELGDMRTLFLDTAAHDIEFLRRHSFMDYSVLVSIESSPTKTSRRFPAYKKLPKFGSLLPEDA